MVNQIPSDLFRRKENLYNLDKCVICLEEFKPRHNVVELACGHIFHDECADPIDECSICRTLKDSTLWLINGKYEGDYEEYLRDVEENAEEDPVELVRQYEAGQQVQGQDNLHILARQRQTEICSTAIKVGLVAILLICIIVSVHSGLTSPLSSTGYSPYNCGPDDYFGQPPGGYTHPE